MDISVPVERAGTPLQPNDKFPLHKLETESVKKVLRNLSQRDLFVYSLISTKTKTLARSLQRKPEYVAFKWDNFMRITIYGWRERNIMCMGAQNVESERRPQADIDLPVSLVFDEEVLETQVRKTKCWIDQIVYVFNITWAQITVDYKLMNAYSLESLRTILVSIQHKSIDLESGLFWKLEEQKHFLFNMFQIEKLHLPHLWNRYCDAYSEVNIQNYQVLEFWDDPYFTLDDLLMINSVSLTVGTDTFSLKDVNRYIKRWMDGFPNPRLRHLELKLKENLFQEKDAILKGINHMIIPEGNERSFKIQSSVHPVSKRIQGGYDIRRKDGVTATITMTHLPGFIFNVSLFVWS